MTGVPVEQMLELWCVELRQVKAHLKNGKIIAHQPLTLQLHALVWAHNLVV